MKSILGDKFLSEFIKHTDDYNKLTDTVKKEELREKAFKKWTAYMMLRNGDNNKYGALKGTLNNQYALGNKQWPSSCSAMTDVMTNHRWDDKYNQVNQKMREKNNQSQESQGYSNSNNDDKGQSLAQSDKKRDLPTRCFKCGEEGHISPKCPLVNIPKDEWWINKQNNLSAAQKTKCVEIRREYEKNKEVNEEKNTIEEKSVTWSGAQRSKHVGTLPELKVKLFQKGFVLTQVNREYEEYEEYESDGKCPSQIERDNYEDDSLIETCIEEYQFINNKSDNREDLNFKYDLALDTSATFTLVRTTEIVTNIRDSKNPILMCTNAGEHRLSKVREIIGMKEEAWVDGESMANLICFAKLAEQYRITYDNWKEDAFQVHTDNGVIKFDKTKEGLYRYKFSKDYLKTVENSKKLNREKSAVTTLAENRGNYSANQFDRAKKARKLYHVVGAPSVKNFKMILRSNQIRNCTVTEKDVDLAEKYSGLT